MGIYSDFMKITSNYFNEYLANEIGGNPQFSENI